MKPLTFYADAARFTDPAAVHRTLQAVFADYEYYGSNLDALYDVLTSIPQAAVLQIAGWQAAETALGDYARRLRRTLDEAAEENENLTVEFC